ncbi:hypothetical protein [Nocardioides convexus]|uniref:hypothetical protein n=1 Tax=Nocardioides convexus TaxID=2712224 RepID=UPI00241864AA|nr:hypothetical protein [Nocardioides convexus]
MLIVRYRDIVDHPAETVDRTCRFLGIREGQVTSIPRDNSRPYVAPGWRPRVVGPVVRGGAWAGQFVRPEIWRRLSIPLVARLQTSDAHRPSLTPEQRERLLPAFADDIALLSDLTGEDFSDWLSTRDRGSFAERVSARP